MNEPEAPRVSVVIPVKDEGDAILLLGAPVDTGDPLQGLGGSACLQVFHRLKTGTPPRCDLGQANTLHTTLLGLIQSGGINSATSIAHRVNNTVCRPSRSPPSRMRSCASR